MSIRERPCIPAIPDNGAPGRAEQLQCGVASSGDGIREADGAHSNAGGENEAEKGLDGVSPIRTGDLGDVGWGEGSVSEVLFDHDGQLRADDSRTGSQVW